MFNILYQFSFLVYNYTKEIKMKIFDKIMQKIFIFEKEPQKIGLSQFKPKCSDNIPEGPSLRKKDIKLSDLMRRAG